jgi:hypothetical protein
MAIQLGIAFVDAQGESDDALFYTDSESNYLGHTTARYGFIMNTLESLPFGKALVLDLPPQSIEQDEEAAVTITPTQGGGKFIENQGNIFKDINLSGTTGFLPVKNFTGLQGQKALAVLNSNEANNPIGRSILANVSGYASFMSLRSMFREYWQIHRNGKPAARDACRLYWMNQKDDESWLVEPLSFRMTRASRSPMTYSYSIRLRTIAKASTSLVPDTSLFAQVQGIIKSVKATLGAVRDAINSAVNLLNGALGFFQQYRNLQTMLLNILDVGTTVAGQLTSLASGAATVLDTPRAVLASATANIVALDQGIFNAADIVMDVPVDALDGLVTMRQQFDYLLARPELFAQEWSATWSSAIQNFNTAYGVGGNVSSALQVAGQRTGLSEATCMSGETIYQFAQRVTGDAQRAHEIIVLNNLKWPYFAVSASERSSGTVAPGDPIMVPVFGASNQNDNLTTSSVGSRDRSAKDEVASATATTLTKSGVQRWRPGEWVGFTVEILAGTGIGQTRLIAANTTFVLTVGTPWATNPDTTSVFSVYFKRLTTPVRVGMESLLGRDLKLVRVPNTDLWTIAIASNGDLDTVQGADNLDQALTVKFMSSPGDFILHPWLGLLPPFGERGDPDSFFKLRLAAQQTLLSDSRIESVQQLAVVQSGDQYQVTAKLAVKGGLHSQYTSPLV